MEEEKGGRGGVATGVGKTRYVNKRLLTTFFPLVLFVELNFSSMFTIMAWLRSNTGN